MGQARSATRGLGVLAAIAATSVFAGCPTAVPEFPAGDTTETTAGSTDAAGTVADTAHGSSEATTSDDRPPTTAADDDDDDAAPSIGARVVFEGGSRIDLGEIDPSTDLPAATLVLHNEGDAPALQLSAPELGPPLAWAGGAFPGAGGTCGASLSSGASCEIVLAAVPGVVGMSARELELTYQDGASSETAVTLLTMIAIGTTADLVANGGFERGPADAVPAGWTAVTGAWRSTADQFYEGQRSALPGSVQFGDVLTLHQTIALDPWAETIAIHGMSVGLEGFARGLNILGDQWRVGLSEIDLQGEATILWQSPTTGGPAWTPFGQESELSPTTRSLRVELECVANSGVDCDAWFDAVQLRLSYP
jgi:hypothetical protein